MQIVLKLVNLHCFEGYNIKRKVQFQTIYNDNLKEKKYFVIEGATSTPVSKEEGNELYKELRKQYPVTKALTIIDVASEEINYVRVCDHYEVHIGNELHCSCQDINEVREEIEKLKEILNKC